MATHRGLLLLLHEVTRRAEIPHRLSNEQRRSGRFREQACTLKPHPHSQASFFSRHVVIPIDSEQQHSLPVVGAEPAAGWQGKGQKGEWG